MIKVYLSAAAAIFILLVSCSSTLRSPIKDSLEFHDLVVKKLGSTDSIDFSAFKGKKVLLVNVASKCGYTPQYAGLESLYRQYKDSLVVLGLPCNQFLFQEPASEDTIKDFCAKKYNVSFPMTEKVYVKGSKQHAIYQWLTQKAHNQKGDYTVDWNFNKFLVSEDGKLLAYFGSKVKPLSKSITDYLK
jgi:glutathione peroxidase